MALWVRPTGMVGFGLGCARLIAAFGRASVENARPAARFWQRFINAHPGHSAATRELLMSTFYLRGQGEDVGKSYSEFRAEFDRPYRPPHRRWTQRCRGIGWVIGRRMKTTGQRRERCFRKAYDLESGDYGYCLGIALKELGRFEESLPLLLESRLTLCSLTR